MEKAFGALSFTPIIRISSSTSPACIPSMKRRRQKACSFFFMPGWIEGFPARSIQKLTRLPRFTRRFRNSASFCRPSLEEKKGVTARHLLGRDPYLDTSFVLREICPWDIPGRFLTEHPARERLLFASDSPWTDRGGRAPVPPAITLSDRRGQGESLFLKRGGAVWD